MFDRSLRYRNRTGNCPRMYRCFGDVNELTSFSRDLRKDRDRPSPRFRLFPPILTLVSEKSNHGRPCSKEWDSQDRCALRRSQYGRIHHVALIEDMQYHQEVIEGYWLLIHRFWFSSQTKRSTTDFWRATLPNTAPTRVTLSTCYDWTLEF